MNYPKLNVIPTSQHIIDSFYGYNHQLRIRDGEFYQTKNLSTSYFPMLASRKPRGLLDIQQAEAQGIINKDALAYVDSGTLYFNSMATPITGMKSGEKQLISMGAYILIWPDKMYYNTADPDDYGNMESHWEYSGRVTYQMCTADGVVYPDAIESRTEPENPDDEELWIDSDENVLKQWSVTMASWVTVESVYTKLTFTTQGQLLTSFKEHDGVEISGAYFDDLNGSKILYAVGGSAGTSEHNFADAVSDYIILVGIVENKFEEDAGSISISRVVPDMDFVCECQNRIWGCFYGNDGTQNINELYCCALGDFKNWSQYLGVATDSWRASVGTDGVWTGAVNYLGNPVFFKEDRIHTISVSSVGAHQVSDTPARGVQQGSHKSLEVVNEILFYKSRSDVCAYQGGFPESVSAKLGDERYYDAVGGSFGQKYYISMKDRAGKSNLFVYDIPRGLWIREDNLNVKQFARMNDELYALVDNKIYALNGTEGTLEKRVEWEAETGILHYEYPGKKYLSKYNIRAALDFSARLTMFIEYDSSGVWEHAGTVMLTHNRAVTFPVKPRRCDHLRLKIHAEGSGKVFSISRILEKGSEI